MAISQKVRNRVKKRDPRCRGCGSDRPAHIHHITFKSRGGVDEEWNLARLCVDCHGRAHNLKDGDPIHSWELYMALSSERAYSVMALRRGGFTKCCGGCDHRSERDECLVRGGVKVEWDFVCELFRERNPRYGGPP